MIPVALRSTLMELAPSCHIRKALQDEDLNKQGVTNLIMVEMKLVYIGLVIK